MKKGFTLSEVLITLVILGVIAAITIPVLNQTRPDRDMVTYQKALYNVQGAMSNVMQDSMASLSTEYWADPEVSESGFCTAFADALNTVGPVNCTGTSTYDSPNLVTSDGIRVWGLEGQKFSQSQRTRDIYVERKLTNKEKGLLTRKRGASYTSPGLKIQIVYNGKVQTGTGTNWEYENSIAKKFAAPMNN